MLPKSFAIALLVASGLLTVHAQTQFSTYTGISGFWDYQVSYRSPQYIRACPGSSIIHAIMMVADDSLNTSASRRTAYAFSSDGGTTWTTFNQLRVPDRKSGYPTLDIGQGSFGCDPIISNHGIVGSTLQSSIYIDDPPGNGVFTEVDPSLAFGGSDEPVFAEIAGTTNGSVVLLGSRLAAGTSHYTQTPDFISWLPWGILTPDFVSDGFVAEANASGRVGVVLGSPFGPLSWFESTDNGSSWPSAPTEIVPAEIPVGSDTFVVLQGLDLVYPASDTMIAFGTTKLVEGNPTSRDEGIGFWSESTGFVLAVPHDSLPGIVDTLVKHQVNQNTITCPAIGMSGSTIVIAFQAFMPETSASGFNYSDIFYTYSRNGGRNWSHPTNITRTPSLDERYPSISKWNNPGDANIVFQEDPQPGSAVFGNDHSPLAMVRQKFVRISGLPTGVNEPQASAPTGFSLEQNYPNPFNPATVIQYTISVGTRHAVSLHVYDVLGREVATLVNGIEMPGNKSVVWDASGMASGVYYYRLQADDFVQTKKLILMK